MKIKDIEKKLNSALEDKAALNSNILEGAKKELSGIKSSNKRKVNMKLALTCCCILIIFVGIAVPIIISVTSSKNYDVIEFNSMQDYFLQKGIPVNTFSEIYEKNNSDSSDSSDDSTSNVFPYKKRKCEIIKYKNEDYFIKETYVYHNETQIENCVILNNNDNIELEEKFFSDFEKLGKNITINGLIIEYSYNIDLKIGKSKFVYKGYEFYMSFLCNSEKDMIIHLQNFINFQKL